MARGLGMGGHHNPVADSDTWLTPPAILDALGNFDLDPCAAPDPRPWPTAGVHYVAADGDGLARPWFGRVWCNPPYGRQTGRWLERLADHGRGTALVFARVETAMFFEQVWARADAVLLLQGRLHFHRPDGTRAAANSGAPSALVAYGDGDADVLATCGLVGTLLTDWDVRPGHRS